MSASTEPAEPASKNQVGRGLKTALPVLCAAAVDQGRISRTSSRIYLFGIIVYPLKSTRALTSVFVQINFSESEIDHCRYDVASDNEMVNLADLLKKKTVIALLSVKSRRYPDRRFNVQAWPRTTITVFHGHPHQILTYRVGHCDTSFVSES